MIVDTTFGALAPSYAKLLATVSIRQSWGGALEKAARKIFGNKARYAAVAQKCGTVPWWLIGIFHEMECGGRFDQHLHNGDPLTRRTRQVPAGRPATGSPPFTWEESALDALMIKGLDKIKDWSDVRIAYEMERFNGFGYRKYHSDVNSPYLWSGTTHYERGKYVRDGVWSQDAKSAQAGAVAIWLTMKSLGLLDTGLAAKPQASAPPVVPHPAAGASVVVAAGAGLSHFAGADLAAMLPWVVGASLVAAFVLFLIRKGFK